MGMSSSSTTNDAILHVVAYDLARGAEKHARALVDELNRDERRHQILTLFAAEPGALQPDHSLDVPRGALRRLGFDPRVVFRLRRLAKARPPAAIVAHGGEPAKYLAVAFGRRIPWVYLTIGSFHPRLASPIRRWMHDYYTSRADRIVAVSTELAEEMRQMHGVASSRVSVIQNGRNVDEFTPATARPKNRRPQLIFVGHLDTGKRPDWFIDVVGEMRERGLDLSAIMVGDGPLKARLGPAAERAGVVMMGERSDVPGLMAESDLLVLTSQPPEGMPGVLIEAGLTGLPVVSTRVPGASDVVEDGVTGLLVGVDDRVALAEAVQHLVSSPTLRVEMGSAARLRCVDRFSMKASAARWAILLAEVAAR